MGNVIVGMTMSLDGFINDRNGDVGILYPDLGALRETEMMQESIRTTGAVVMGRRAYEMAAGDFGGYEFQVPIFVVTHRAPDRAAKGENERLTFTFVTDGVASAITQAKAAAGAKDVTVVGGAHTAQQLLAAGLVDVLEVGIMPVLLGGGQRFFEHLGAAPIALEKISVIQSPGRTDLKFRVVRERGK